MAPLFYEVNVCSVVSGQLVYFKRIRHRTQTLGMAIWSVGRSTDPPLWSRLNYLYNYWRDCNEILPSPEDESY